MLTARLVNTAIFEEDDLGQIQTELKLIDWGEFSKFRNRVFYDGAFWPLHADTKACDLVKGAHNAEMAIAALLEDSRSSAPFAGEYFIAATLLRKLVIGMFESLAEIAPAIEAEVDAFKALRP